MQSKGLIAISLWNVIKPALLQGFRWTYKVSQSVSTAVVIVSLICSGLSVCFAGVALPEIGVVGQPIDSQHTWFVASTNAIFPTSIQCDLRNARIVGMICEYPEKSINYLTVKSEMQDLLKIEPRLSDDFTTTWRVEQKRCAVMVDRDAESKSIRIVVRCFDN